MCLCFLFGPWIDYEIHETVVVHLNVLESGGIREWIELYQLPFSFFDV